MSVVERMNEVSSRQPTTWTRETVADGIWLNKGTILPLSARDEFLADEIDKIENGNVSLITVGEGLTGDGSTANPLGIDGTSIHSEDSYYGLALSQDSNIDDVVDVALGNKSSADGCSLCFDESVASEHSLAFMHASALSGSIAIYNATANRNSFALGGRGNNAESGPAYANDTSFAIHSSASHAGFAFNNSSAEEASVAFNGSVAYRGSVALGGMSSKAEYGSLSFNGGKSKNGSCAIGYEASASDGSIAFFGSATNKSISLKGTKADDGSLTILNSTANNHSIAINNSITDNAGFANCYSSADNGGFANYYSSADLISFAHGRAKATGTSIAFFDSIALNSSLGIINSNVENSSLGFIGSNAKNSSIALENSTAEYASLASHSSTATQGSIALNYSNADAGSLAIYHSTAKNDSFGYNYSNALNASIALGLGKVNGGDNITVASGKSISFGGQCSATDESFAIGLYSSATSGGYAFGKSVYAKGCSIEGSIKNQVVVGSYSPIPTNTAAFEYNALFAVANGYNDLNRSYAFLVLSDGTISAKQFKYTNSDGSVHTLGGNTTDSNSIDSTIKKLEDRIAILEAQMDVLIGINK